MGEPLTPNIMRQLALFAVFEAEARRRHQRSRRFPVWWHLADVLRECGFRLVVTP